MKSRKLKVFAFGVIATSVMTLSVSAKDVSNISGLKDCLADANETECKLTSTTWLNQNNEQFKVTNTKTLDLNSQHLDLSNGIITVSTGASLTVKNGEIEKGKEATTGRVIEVQPGGKLDIASGTTLTGHEQDNYAAIGIIGSSGSKKTVVDIAGTVNGGVVAKSKDDTNVANGITLSINEGAVIKAEGNAVSINGRVKTGTTVVNVLNATIESTKGQGIYAAGLGTWNITGATVSGTEGIGIKSGTVNIHGGKFTGTGEDTDIDNVEGNVGKTDVTGAAISVTTSESNNYAGQIKLTIDGDVQAESKNNYAIEVATPTNNNALSSISVKGGTFTGAKGGMKVASDFKSDEKVKNSVTGGTFQIKAADGTVKADEGVTDYAADELTVDPETGKVLTQYKVTISEDAETYTEVPGLTDTSLDEEIGKVSVQVADADAVDEESEPAIAVAGDEVVVSVQNIDKETYDYVIEVTTDDGTVVDVTDNKFVMPESNVTVKVTYKLKDFEITGEDVNLEEKNTAKKDEKVKVKIKDHDGYTIGEVTVTPATGGSVLASLVEDTEDNEYEFIMPGCAVAIAVKYNAIKYNITKEETTNGSFTISKAEGFVGEEIIVDAKPAEGYIVDKITYTYQAKKLDENGQATDELESKTEEATVVKNTGKFAIPADMSEGKTIVVAVSFKEGNYDRTITVENATNGKVDAPKTAEVGDEVTVTVTPAAGYEVDTVVVKTEDGTEVAYKDGKFTMPDGNVTISATFKEQTKEPEGDEPGTTPGEQDPSKDPEDQKPSEGEDNRPEEDPSVLTDNGVSFNGGEEFTKDGYEFKAVEVEKTEDEIKEMSMTGFDYVTTYDLKMLKNGQVVEMVDGSYKISIPVEDLYDVYKVAYIEDGKIVEELDATYENGNVVFTTTHLSEYAVYGRKADSTNNATVVNPQTGDSILKYVAIAMLSVGALGISLKKYVK